MLWWFQIDNKVTQPYIHVSILLQFPLVSSHLKRWRGSFLPDGEGTSHLRVYDLLQGEEGGQEVLPVSAISQNHMVNIFHLLNHYIWGQHVQNSITGHWYFPASHLEYSLLKRSMLCAQSCPTLCDSMDYSLPGSSVCGISQINCENIIND